MYGTSSFLYFGASFFTQTMWLSQRLREEAFWESPTLAAHGVRESVEFGRVAGGEDIQDNFPPAQGAVLRAIFAQRWCTACLISSVRVATVGFASFLSSMAFPTPGPPKSRRFTFLASASFSQSMTSQGSLSCANTLARS